MIRTTKAEAGIGTLILFIALILVAAVAAGVLIQTSGSLQSRALATGSQAQTQVSSKIIVLSAWGEDGTSTKFDKVFFKAKLAPGSDPIPLTTTYLSFDTDSTKQTLRYSASLNCASDPTSTSSFGVTGRVGYASAGYLLDGDIVDMCFLSTINVTEGKHIKVSIAPKTGSLTSFSTTAPDVMTEKRVALYP